MGPVLLRFSVVKEVSTLAHSRSTKKRIRQNERNRLVNKMVVTKLRNIIKRTEHSLATNNADDAKKLVPTMIKTIDLSVAKGYVHKNTAARKKSRIMKQYREVVGT